MNFAKLCTVVILFFFRKTTFQTEFLFKELYKIPYCPFVSPFFPSHVYLFTVQRRNSIQCFGGGGVLTYNLPTPFFFVVYSSFSFASS